MTDGRKSGDILLSVVIPAYNEEDNIRSGALQEVAEYLADQEYASELIVVDDGSEDATAALVAEAAGRWEFVSSLAGEHGGKAHAVTLGVLAAKGKYVIFTDMDQSTPIRFVKDALAELETGSDVVIGSRLLKGAHRLDEPLVRSVLGRVFVMLVRALLLPEIRDSQCGFKGFRGDAARELFGNMMVFRTGSQGVVGPAVTAFDVELLVMARKRGFSIKEIPVTWRHVATRRVSIVRDAYRMSKEVALVWLNRLRGQYDVARG